MTAPLAPSIGSADFNATSAADRSLLQGDVAPDSVSRVVLRGRLSGSCERRLRQAVDAERPEVQ